MEKSERVILGELIKLVDRLAELQKKKETEERNKHSRSHEEWSDDEDKLLYSAIEAAIESIARNHQRSPRAIVFRIARKGYFDVL